MSSSETGAIERHTHFTSHPPGGVLSALCLQPRCLHLHKGQTVLTLAATTYGVSASPIHNLRPAIFSQLYTARKARQGSKHFVIPRDCMYCRALSRHLHIFAFYICRHQSAETAGPSQPSRAVLEHSQHAKDSPPRHPSSTNSHLAGPTFASAAASAPSAPGQPQLQGQSPERPSAFIHALSQAPASSPYRPRIETSPQTDCVQLSLEVSEASSSVQAILSPTSSIQANSQLTSGVKHDDLHAAPAAVHLEQQLDGSLGLSSQLTSAEHETDANQGGVQDSDETGELQRLLAEERKETAALIGKFPKHVSFPLDSCQPAAVSALC